MEMISYIDDSTSADWRGCLMLSMPNDVAEMISAWSENNILESELANNGRETYSHCTILYGFPQFVTSRGVKEVLDYGYSLNSIDKIPIQLGKIKRFSGNLDYDVLVIEVEEGLLIRQMHYTLKDKFNVKTNFPTYNPHVTIAYVKPNSLSHLDGNATFAGLSVNGKEITFSTGPSESRKLDRIKS